MAFGWFRRNRTAQVNPQAVAPVEVATKTVEPASEASVETRRDEPSPPRPPAPVSFPPEKVAARAYEIWVRKGKPHGAELQNWLEAEVELRAEYAANPEPAAPIRKPR